MFDQMAKIKLIFFYYSNNTFVHALMTWLWPNVPDFFYWKRIFYKRFTMLNLLYRFVFYCAHNRFG